MKVKKLTLKDTSFPDKLRHIPSPPNTLYVRSRGAVPVAAPTLAVVGSRKMSAYGKHVTEEFVSRLAQAGVTIVSGLALGIDGVAHKAALASNGATVAVLPCGLDTIYPATHGRLAREIIDKGGFLISEYPVGVPPLKQHFIARNRIISGLADALLITEAAEKSGTLHTANFALEQGKDVFVVPGNITSYLSRGTNGLLKAGAIPVTSQQDIMSALNIPLTKKHVPEAESKEEYLILSLLSNGIHEIDELLAGSRLQPAAFNQTLTMLEITGKIKPIGNNRWVLA